MTEIGNTNSEAENGLQNNVMGAFEVLGMNGNDRRLNDLCYDRKLCECNSFTKQRCI